MDVPARVGYNSRKCHTLRYGIASIGLSLRIQSGSGQRWIEVVAPTHAGRGSGPWTRGPATDVAVRAGRTLIVLPTRLPMAQSRRVSTSCIVATTVSVRILRIFKLGQRGRTPTRWSRQEEAAGSENPMNRSVRTAVISTIVEGSFGANVDAPSDKTVVLQTVKAVA